MPIKYTELEETKLRQELRHNTIKLLLSIIGASIVLLGLVVDRINTHEQRQHAFRVAEFNQRMTRMNAIVEEYDRIFSQTMAVLYKNRTRTWQLITHVGLLSQELRGLDVKDAEIIRLKEYINDVYLSLAGASVTVDEWADAFVLEAQWDALGHSLTPDFYYYFGDDLVTKWKELRDSALSALRAEYSIAGTHRQDKLDCFTELGAVYQRCLYEKIAEQPSTSQ